MILRLQRSEFFGKPSQTLERRIGRHFGALHAFLNCPAKLLVALKLA